MTKDAFDERLACLFAEKNEPLPDQEFMRQVVLRLEREHRLQWMRHGVMVVTIMVIAAVISPLVVQGMMGAFSLIGKIKQLPGIDSMILISMALITSGVLMRARRWL